MIGGAIVIVIFVVENAECGLIVGKTPHALMRSIILAEYFSFSLAYIVPWVWAGVMTLYTIFVIKRGVIREKGAACIPRSAI